MKRLLTTHLVLAVTSALLALGCQGKPPAEGPEGGSAHFTIASQALSAEDVTRVTVTLAAADIPALTLELTRTGDTWGGTIAAIRAGDNRNFTAEAFAGVTKIFEGQAQGVTIVRGQTAEVVIILQPIDRPAPFENAAPVIDSLVASAGTVEPSGVISLRATGHDPNTADVVTSAWTATGGSFSDAAVLTTAWTAPAEEGTYTLTLRLSDARGAATAMSFAVTVQTVGRGKANIQVIINTWPEVSRVTSSQTRVNVGEALTAEVFASDEDGNMLQYNWASTCPGSFADATTRVAAFTPSALPAGACNNCRLEVTVSDGRGGTTTGRLDVCVSRPLQPTYPPTVETAYQAAQTVSEGDPVRLFIQANDPQGRPLAFSWSTNVGILGTAVHSNNTSELRWTAPSCVSAGVTPSITVTATNEAGLTVSQTFTLTWNGTACAEGTSFCFAQTDYEGHWLLDQAFLDSSASARHFNPLGGTDWVSDGDAIWGQGVVASGGVAARPVNDTAFDFGNRDFSVMSWVRRTYADSAILSKASDFGASAGWSLRSYYGQLYFYSPLGNLISNNVLAHGQWRHIAAVRSGSTLTLYIDGRADVSRTLSGSIPATSAPLRLGQAGTTGFYGSLDEVVILNRAATPLEVASVASKSCR
ncbi:MAG TPA: LamG-like jellyroll fold domain-containing protein [Myxococcus sp.]|nr:LamG-like jellyroll fold domain-containing protein [Myxococcus sp.]